METLSKSIRTILLAVVLVFASSCTKNNDDNGGGNTSLGNVTVTTLTLTDITSTGATCGAEVTAEAGAMLMEMGVCWSTTAYPTINDSYLSTKNCVTTFVCTLESLSPETKYHVRAYVLNGTDYVYGESKEFTTLSESGGGFDDHEWVDLGLPSGTLWATCNIGATTPEEYGLYFAWGETQPKNIYDWSTYKYCNGDYNQMTKYCNDSDHGYNGFTDNLTVLQSEDDAATENWGNRWNMPTNGQWIELYENTTHVWTTRNGVYGRLFTGSNGNTLFLPAGGCCWSSNNQNLGTSGYYWSSSLSDHASSAMVFANGINSISGLNYFNMDPFSRFFGLTIRPVLSVK